MSQPDGLIAVLLDKSAELGDRDDAAMDLGEFDEARAEEALVMVVTEESEDEGLVDSAAESLGDIWRRKKKFDSNLVKTMHPAATRLFKSWQ